MGTGLETAASAVSGELATIEREVAISADALRADAMGLLIESVEDAEYGDALRAQIVERRKRIEAWFVEPVAAAHAAHKLLCDRRATNLAPFLEIERLVNGKLIAWQTEQERLRREAEQAAAEAARIAAEEAQLAAALAAEAVGDTERAAAVLDAPPPPVLVPRPAVPVPPKLAATGFQQRYRAEVDDLMLLAKGVVAGTVPLEAITANMPFLNNQARALKTALRYPGVHVEVEAGVRSKRP